MANTTVRITFTGIPEVDDNISVTPHLKVPPFSLVPRIEVFKTLRVNPGEATIGETSAETAANYAAALLADSPSAQYFIVTVLANVVTITINPDGNYDYFTEFDINGDFATAEFVSTTIGITGLENNYYLINNEINVTLSASAAVESFTVQFHNQSNQKSSVPVVVYPSPIGVCKLEISGYIKSLFDLPSDPETYTVNLEPTTNANNFQITVSYKDISESIIKTFIRGGVRTNNTNQFLSVNQVCRPTYKLPMWQGYPTADYQLNEDGQVIKLTHGYPLAQRDVRRKKGCNEIYVKFLNQQGGYCHWLFETHQNTQTSQGLGSFVRDNKLEDLGVTSDMKLKATAKIPEYYKGYVQDLIDSPEIWVMIDGEFVRILSGKNTFTYDEIRRSYSVSINLDFDYRYNPSLLWQ